jgi:hypothetical protein
MLMLSTILIVPIVAVLTVTLNIFPEVFIPLVSIFCFIGGLLRMLYALLMEDANPPIDSPQLSGYAPPAPAQLEAARPLASVQPSYNPAQAWKPRPNTAEIFTPPSVTENTTRLLQKDDQEER